MSNTLTLELTPEQVSRVKRDAANAGYATWQSYLQSLLDAKVFNSQIGAPVIKRPSFAKSIVTGPSQCQ